RLWIFSLARSTNMSTSSEDNFRLAEDKEQVERKIKIVRRGDNDDNESSNDDDDDNDVEKDEEDKEEEEHLAPADPSDVSTDDLVPSS
nr:hypothetical protein [Tanacetum cinerariifolium]